MRGDRRMKCGRRIGALLVAVILLLGMQTSAYAESVTAHLPVEQTFSTNLTGVDNVFHYVLRAEETGAPMPDGSVNGEYAFTLRGNTSIDLQFNASQAGTYHYTLTQDVIDAEEWYEYDRRQYTVMLQVYVGSDGRLTSVLLIYNPAGEKVETAVFSNRYAQPAPPADPISPTSPITPPGIGGNVQTGDENNLPFYLAMMAASALGMILLLVWARKKGKNSEGDANYEK